eukprot:1446834-Pleurochrysis_carterae.AAC.6
MTRVDISSHVNAAISRTVSNPSYQDVQAAHCLKVSFTFLPDNEYALSSLASKALANSVTIVSSLTVDGHGFACTI